MPISRTWLPGSLSIIACAAALFAVSAACAQAPAAAGDLPAYTPTLTFDVATIRESGPNDTHSLRVGVVSPPHSSKFEITNFTAKSLIQLAYGFGVPVSGGPGWISDKYYNIQAKSDPATDEKLAKLPEDQARLEKQHMVKVLLAERFGLKEHEETRQSSIYELTVAKGGIKMQPVDPPPPPDPGQPTPAPPAADVQAHGGRQGLEFVVHAMSARAIAAMLVSQLSMPVVDKTGLTGTYNFTLQMGREWSANDPEGWPDIYAAVQQQLGLKLEPTKADIPNLIIDHIQPPSDN